MLYLDIETLDFFQDLHIANLPRDRQIEAMRFGCAVTHSQGAGWVEWETNRCYDLYDTLCIHLDRQQQIVGWNIIDFDLPVIFHNAARAQKVGGVDSARLKPNPLFVDLFAMIRQSTGRWYSLESVAQANLGRGKLADGQRAAEWLRSGDPELVAKALTYCRADVQLTIDLHTILLRGDPLRLPALPKRKVYSQIAWWLDGQEKAL